MGLKNLIGILLKLICTQIKHKIFIFYFLKISKLIKILSQKKKRFEVEKIFVQNKKSVRYD